MRPFTKKFKIIIKENRLAPQEYSKTLVNAMANWVLIWFSISLLVDTESLVRAWTIRFFQALHTNFRL